MRWILIALVTTSCAHEEPKRIPESRAPAAPVAASATFAAMAPPTTAETALGPAPESAPAVACAEAAEPAPVVAAVDPRETTRRAAHDVLAEMCGECHEGHRPTAKPKALAIFDLDQPDWPSRFDDHRYKAALMRLSKSPSARDTFIAFRDAELAAAKPN